MLKVPVRKPRVNLVRDYLSKTTGKSDELRSLDTSTKEDYRLTVCSIFKLLINPRNLTIYRNRITGATFRLNSARQVNRVTGISNTVIHNALRNEEEGKWVELEQETLVRLAYLLEVIEPALVDPEDPEEQSIRFSDRYENGALVRGWQQLRRLHEQSAPAPQDILFADMDKQNDDTPADRVSVLSVSKDVKSSIKRLILRSLKGEDSYQSEPVLGEPVSWSCDRLAQLIAADIGERELQGYAEAIVKQDLSLLAKQDRDKVKTADRVAEFITGLQMILGGVIPSGQVYATTMRLLATYLPPSSNGDITALAKRCLANPQLK